MEPDLTIELINATVQIEAPLPDGRRTVGTGFLVEAPTPDGRPRTVLVTAAHVLDHMQGDTMRVGWRFSDSGNTWRYAPAPVTIRLDGRPLYVTHPTYDIAVMKIIAPPEFGHAAIPLAWLADERSFEDWGIGPGDEMMTVGYPLGQSSNRAGFPILRTGRLASYPLYPIEQFPTFLVDLRVLGGNSGGPVFMTGYTRRRPGTEQSAESFVAGVLTKQLCLEIGVVTHAYFVRETIRMLDDPGLMRPRAPAPATQPPPPSAPQLC
jgi:S1-C subfamily serine protease